MTELAVVVRFAHLAACVLLAGSHAYITLIAAPTGAVVAWHRNVVRTCLPVIVLSGLAGLWIQAGILGATTLSQSGAGIESGPARYAALLTGTFHGQVMLARMLLAAALFGLLMRTGHERAATASTRLPAFLSALLLASIALSGHAAASDGLAFAFEAGIASLHLLAAGVWVGALSPLIIALRHCSHTPDAADADAVRQVTSKFSRLGIACVATLLITGAVNATVHVGGIPQLVGTPYGHSLLLKLALLLPMLAIAAFNLLRINPAIADATAATLPGHARALARNAMIEAMLGMTILLAAATLGSTPPARHVQPDWPFAFRWDWSLLDTAPKALGEFQGGLAWAVGAVLLLQLVWLTRRWRSPIAIRVLGVIGGIAMMIHASMRIFTPVYTDAYPTTYHRPDVVYNAISVAGGKSLFAKHCVACHGPHGYGDGPLAGKLDPKPADLTGRHANAHTAGDLYWWLTNGKSGSAMPGFGTTLTAEDRWDLINFVRALAGGRRARKLAPIIEDQPWLAAPDFAYATTAGTNRTLKDHRGERLVLLALAQGDDADVQLTRLEAAAERLKAAGIDLIVVPREPGRRRSQLPLVSEGNAEIHETYGLLTSGFADDTAASQHVEFLIDRQGYIRARWFPAASTAWADPAGLIKQAEQLLREKLVAPPPDDHVH